MLGNNILLEIHTTPNENNLLFLARKKMLLRQHFILVVSLLVYLM